MTTHQSPQQKTRLRHRRDEVARRREQAIERVALFPNPVNRRQVEELSAELEELDRRLAAPGPA